MYPIHICYEPDAQHQRRSAAPSAACYCSATSVESALAEVSGKRYMPFISGRFQDINQRDRERTVAGGEIPHADLIGSAGLSVAIGLGRWTSDIQTEVGCKIS